MTEAATECWARSDDDLDPGHPELEIGTGTDLEMGDAGIARVTEQIEIETETAAGIATETAGIETEDAIGSTVVQHWAYCLYCGMHSSIMRFSSRLHSQDQSVAAPIVSVKLEARV